MIPSHAFYILSLLFVLALIGKSVANRIRIRALTPQEGRIWRGTFMGWAFLFVFPAGQIDSFYLWLFQDGPTPSPLLAVTLAASWACAFGVIVQPEGPLQWSPEGVAGPQVTGFHPFRHNRIGWDEVSRIIFRTGRFGKGGAWEIRAANGRFVTFTTSCPGHESALAALRHYRPDLDPGVLTL